MRRPLPRLQLSAASMKVPPKRKGNALAACLSSDALSASMKVPPKRKGNLKGGERLM